MSKRKRNSVKPREEQKPTKQPSRRAKKSVLPPPTVINNHYHIGGDVHGGIGGNAQVGNNRRDASVLAQATAVPTERGKMLAFVAKVSGIIGASWLSGILKEAA